MEIEPLEPLDMEPLDIEPLETDPPEYPPVLRARGIEPKLPPRERLGAL